MMDMQVIVRSSFPSLYFQAAFRLTVFYSRQTILALARYTDLSIHHHNVKPIDKGLMGIVGRVCPEFELQKVAKVNN